jgi:5'-nucleotidase
VPVTLQILLTNDDGIHAHGIAVLRRAVEGLGEVTTIAPERNASAVARAITIDRALTLRPVTFGDGWSGLACDGTPTDCVRVGLLGEVAPAPDIVLSGINLGANMGADVTYSGTVGAAFEATLRGRPAVAFSVESTAPRWLDEAVDVVRDLVERTAGRGLPRRTMLNINLPDRPAAEFTGVLPARLGGVSRCDRVFLTGDGDGHGSAEAVREECGLPLAADGRPAAHAYSVLGDDPDAGNPAATDFDVVAAGAVAVTPLRHDLLDADLLAELGDWRLGMERIGG